MNSDDEKPSNSERILTFFRKCVPFFCIYTIYRRKFPKKGSLAWSLKYLTKIAELGHEVAIKDKKVSIGIKPGKYSEPIRLEKGINIHSLSLNNPIPHVIPDREPKA
jgi:hypothetical protein